MHMQRSSPACGDRSLFENGQGAIGVLARDLQVNQICIGSLEAHTPVISPFSCRYLDSLAAVGVEVVSGKTAERKYRHQSEQKFTSVHGMDLVSRQENN